MDFPRERRAQISSTDPPARVDKAGKRRSDVVAVLPDHAAVLRLAGALTIEQNDDRAPYPPPPGALLHQACAGFPSRVQRLSWAACPSPRPPATASCTGRPTIPRCVRADC
jgi:hypothetical protein